MATKLKCCASECDIQVEPRTLYCSDHWKWLPLVYKGPLIEHYKIGQFEDHDLITGPFLLAVTAATQALERIRLTKGRDGTKTGRGRRK